MDSLQQPEDDGIIRIQRLVPGQVDVVLGSHPRRKRVDAPRRSRPYGLWLACLIAAACVAGLITSHARDPKALAVPPVVQSTPETRTVDAEAQPVAAADPAPAHIRKTAELVPIAATVAPPAPVQPLDDCMKKATSSMRRWRTADSASFHAPLRQNRQQAWCLPTTWPISRPMLHATPRVLPGLTA